MHRILDKASSDLDISLVGWLSLYPAEAADREQFKKADIQVPYVHGGREDKRTYSVYCRNSMDAILDVIQDPDLHSSFIYYPEHHYVLNPRTKKNMRVWTDIHTGDDWWKLQVCSTSVILATG